MMHSHSFEASGDVLGPISGDEAAVELGDVHLASGRCSVRH